MGNIVGHAKTLNTVRNPDWTQAQLDAAIAAGQFAAGTTLADIMLGSDFNNDHVVDLTQATAKTSLADTDLIPLADGAALFVFKKITWANVKSALAAILVPQTTTVNGHALNANVTVTSSDVGLSAVTNDVQTRAAVMPNTAPAAGAIPVGNAGGTAYAPVAVSGDATLTSAGALTIAAGAVTLAKQANLAANSIQGNNTGAAATPIALTAAQVKALLAIANTDVSGLGTMSTQAASAVAITGGSAVGTSLKNYTETVYAGGNTGTAVTLALSNGNVQTWTLTGNCVFTMPAATAGASFRMALATGAGGFTATFTGAKWPGGTAPTITSTASKTDRLVFDCHDGANWYGSVIGQNY